MGAVLALLVALCGCFNPKIADGGFSCAATGQCPEGFRCEQDTGLCKHHPSAIVGGEGGAAGGGEDVGGAGGSGGAGGGAPCFEPRQSCEPSENGVCDPYCRTGCGDCREKCSVNTTGALTCNQPMLAKLAGTLEACSIHASGSSSQADDCAPGHVCIEGQTCFPRCFRFCRSDQDCDNAYCDGVAGNGTQRVCGIANTDTCTPLGVPNNGGCGPGMACYVSSSHPEHTFCECPLGNGGVGTECTQERDCNPGLACAYILRAGKAQCQQVCELSRGGVECLNTGHCLQYAGASGGGAPHARWGFCY